MVTLLSMRPYCSKRVTAGPFGRGISSPSYCVQIRHVGLGCLPGRAAKRTIDRRRGVITALSRRVGARQPYWATEFGRAVEHPVPRPISTINELRVSTFDRQSSTFDLGEACGADRGC